MSTVRVNVGSCQLLLRAVMEAFVVLTPLEVGLLLWLFPLAAL